VAAQRQDLRDLRSATDARQSLTAGTPEHDRALEREDELIARIRAWAEDRRS
jgi:hypothetical protein